MIHRRQFLAAAAVLGISLDLSSEARADAVDDTLGRISKARESVKTLQAPFEQTRVIGLLASEVKSKGKLTLVRPDRLRWDLFPPDEVTYWIGPEGLAMRSADGVTKIGKAAAGRFASVLGDLLVMLGGDMRTLRKRYDIAVAESGDTLTITAKPKSDDVKKHIASLKMKARERGAVVERIEIHEQNGDESIIVFGKMTKNEPVDPDYIAPPKKA
jgi:outer membrane lipoprotein-sorting protein